MNTPEHDDVIHARPEDQAVSRVYQDPNEWRSLYEQEHQRAETMAAAGEQQAAIIGAVHDMCESLERAIALAEAGLLVGEVTIMKAIEADLRKAAGLDTKDEEGEDV